MDKKLVIEMPNSITLEAVTQVIKDCHTVFGKNNIVVVPTTKTDVKIHEIEWSNEHDAKNQKSG